MSSTTSASPSTSSMTPEQQAAEAMVAEVLRITHISQVYYAAVISVVIWDWLLHLKTEYQLIWKAKWSAGKIAYILVRYITTIFAVIIVSIGTFKDFTPSACVKYVKVDALLAVLVSMSCETVLGLRAWSIWNRNKWLSAYLLIHWLAVFVILLVNVGVSVHHTQFVSATGPCIPTGSGFFTSFWISILSFEVATTALMAIRSIQLMGSSSLTGKSFLSVVLRDGLAYFLIVCSLNIINIVFALQTINPLLQGVNNAPTTYLTSVACCHLVLSLLSSNQGKPESHYGSASEYNRSGLSNPDRPLPTMRKVNTAQQFKLSRPRDEFNQSTTNSLEELKDSNVPDLGNIRVTTEVEVHEESENRSIV